MCDVPSIAVFCKMSIECVSGIAYRFFFNLITIIIIIIIIIKETLLLLSKFPGSVLSSLWYTNNANKLSFGKWTGGSTQQHRNEAVRLG
jgi:hypothetical protein